VPKLLLIRHGMTGLQKEDRYWGSTDVPLNDLGIKQAEQIRDRLAGERFSYVYTSPLSRALDTAKIIAAGRRRDVIPCDELCECNFGYLEGLTYEEIKAMHPAVARQLGRMEAVSFPGGESLEQFHTRVQAFLKRLEKHRPHDTLAVVAHGGSLRMLLCRLLDLEFKHWHRLKIDRASISIVDVYPGVSILSSLNDTNHLKHF